MNNPLWRWYLGGVCAVLTGCAAEYEGPVRYPLSGKVTYDGQPIDVGSITFLPMSNGDQQRVSGGEITDGVYSVPEAKGANAGKYRIVIHWDKLTGRKVPDPGNPSLISDERLEGLPARFHKSSELMAEVTGEQTTFDFHLKSK